MSFLIGLLAHFAFGMEDWITAAIMFNNTTSYPLLLIQSLDETGILAVLTGKDESTREAIERAKSYFLVFATISSCLTFAVGPRLIEGEHAPEEEEVRKEGVDGDDEEGQDRFPRVDIDVFGNGNGNGSGGRERSTPPTETSGLLAPPSQSPLRRASSASISFFPSRRLSSSPQDFRRPSIVPDRRPSLISHRRWLTLSDRGRWWLLFLWDFINTPLIGALLGAVIGLIPSLHVAFFADSQDGGIFTAWLTASLKNIGGLFVPLPVVVAGVSLYSSMKKSREDRKKRVENGGDGESGSGAGRDEKGTPWKTTAFILVVRFVLWPVASISVIYTLAKKTSFLGTDPMLWFALMLMPTGPPAMKVRFHPFSMCQIGRAHV